MGKQLNDFDEPFQGWKDELEAAKANEVVDQDQEEEWCLDKRPPKVESF